MIVRIILIVCFKKQMSNRFLTILTSFVQLFTGPYTFVDSVGQDCLLFVNVDTMNNTVGVICVETLKLKA